MVRENLGCRHVPARVLIADDHELVRDGFKRMLGYEEDLAVVARPQTVGRPWSCATT